MDIHTKMRLRVLPCIILIILLSILGESTWKISVFSPVAKSIRPRDADINGDGLVDRQDFDKIVSYLGLYPSHAEWNPKADINEDGSVNVLDIILARNVFGKTHVRTLIVAYVSGFTDETAEFVASNFDIVIMEFRAASSTSKIKALNPNITILAYRDIIAMHTYYDDWAEVNPHEDWFIHDIHGNRLVHKGYGWYAMDVGNPGWRNHYANYVKNKLDNSLFDGVFADDTWDFFRYNDWTVPVGDIPTEIGQSWHNNMLGMISFVKSTIGSKLLIINTENNGDYVDAADGKMLEHFVHNRSWELDYYGPPYFNPLEHVDALAEVSSRGKIYLAVSLTNIPDYPTQDDLNKTHKIMLYCLSAYLLGINGEKAAFGFNTIASKDGSKGFYSEFDVSVGSPVGQYYSIGSVYARNFTEGIVLLNPTNMSYTIPFEERYMTPDGKNVTSTVLAAHEGIVLVKLHTN